MLRPCLSQQEAHEGGKSRSASVQSLDNVNGDNPPSSPRLPAIHHRPTARRWVAESSGRRREAGPILSTGISNDYPMDYMCKVINGLTCRLLQIQRPSCVVYLAGHWRQIRVTHRDYAVWARFLVPAGEEVRDERKRERVFNVPISSVLLGVIRCRAG